MYKDEKRKVLDCALKIRENKLVSLTGGNVSMRLSDNRFLVTPSGMDYTKMVAEDVVLVDGTGSVIEGKRKPSSDTSALLYVFNHMPHVNAIIHTHQPYATALGLVEEEIPACLVTIIDAVHSAVKVAPYTPSSDINMGVLTVQYAGDALAVILKHHGVMAYGASLEEALYAAVYLEESAKTYLLARLLGDVPRLSEEEIAAESEGWKSYGQ
jgi:L-ribulose-5-phosphate 4-epimerase